MSPDDRHPRLRKRRMTMDEMDICPDCKEWASFIRDPDDGEEELVSECCSVAMAFRP